MLGCTVTRERVSDVLMYMYIHVLCGKLYVATPLYGFVSVFLPFFIFLFDIFGICQWPPCIYFGHHTSGYFRHGFLLVIAERCSLQPSPAQRANFYELYTSPTHFAFYPMPTCTEGALDHVDCEPGREQRDVDRTECSHDVRVRELEPRKSLGIIIFQ